VFEGYLAGLRDAAWGGDERAARLGYTAAVAMRYGLNSTPLWLVGDEPGQERFTRSLGYASFDQVLVWVAELRVFVLDLADEACRLAETR